VAETVRDELKVGTAKVSAKGWVVIPAALRKKYGLVPGSEVMVVDYGGVLSLVPQVDEPVVQAAGALPRDPSLSSLLVADHRRELNDE